MRRWFFLFLSICSIATSFSIEASPLSCLNPLKLLYRRNPLPELGKKKLFDGDPRENAARHIREAFQNQTENSQMSPQERDDLLRIVQKDLEFLENISKLPTDEGVETSLEVAQKLRLLNARLARTNPELFVLSPAARKTIDGYKKTKKYIYYGIILSSLFTLASVAKEPYNSKIRQISFALADWIYPAADHRGSNSAAQDAELKSELLQIYRLSNSHFTGVEQIAGSRITYLESSVVAMRQTLVGLEQQNDRVGIEQMLKILHSWKLRYPDLLESKQGQNVSGLIDSIFARYEPQPLPAEQILQPRQVLTQVDVGSKDR